MMPRPPDRTEFQILADRAISRRRFVAGGTAAFVASALPPGTATASSRFEFEPVATNTRDTVTVPTGYRWHVVARWGDPLWSDGVPFDPQTRGTGASQERAIGDNNDGMALFRSGGRNILAVNNE